MYSSLSSWQFPLRFGQGLVSALWNSFERSWRWFIKQRKKPEETSSCPGCISLSEVNFQKRFLTQTPFWSSALDFERDLPSTVCSIPSAKELIVLQESRLSLLAFPLVLAVVPSVCRSHGSIILLVLQLSVSSPSHAVFSFFGARALGSLA